MDRKANRARRDRRPAFPLMHVATWATVSVMFVGSWHSGGDGFFWPVFPILGWGSAVFNDVARWRDARTAAATPTTAPALPEPAPKPLAKEAALVRKVCAELRNEGLESQAAGLEAALADARQLHDAQSAFTTLEADISAAKDEAAALRARAEASVDAEARQTWAQSAALAERRLTSLESLRATGERVAARLSAFEQLVRTLAVGGAHAALAQLPARALPSEAENLEQELEALRRTRQELGALRA